MSEQAPEAPGRAGPRSSGPKSSGGLPEFLTRKIGGFPVWVYGAVVAGLLLWRYQSSKSAAATSTSSTPATTTGTAMTDASQVPQFVNQTYTSTLPPHGHGSASTPATTPIVTPGSTTTTPAVTTDTGPAALTPVQQQQWNQNLLAAYQAVGQTPPAYVTAGAASPGGTMTKQQTQQAAAQQVALYRAQGQTPPAGLVHLAAYGW